MKSKPDMDKIWSILADKYGLHNEKELDEAVRMMEPLEIGFMAAPIKKQKNT